MVRDGHPPDVALSYTPRELKGWIELGERRRKRDRAELIEALLIANPQSKDQAKNSNRKLRKLIEESQ